MTESVVAIVAAIVILGLLIIIVLMTVKSLRTASQMQERLVAMHQLVNTRLAEIHDLVNSRLSAALNKIDRLELRIQALTGEAPTGEPPAE